MSQINNRVIKQPRKRLTLKEKWNIIELRKSLSIVELSKRFEVGHSTIYKILEHKNELEKEWILSKNSSSKVKLRDPKHANINAAVLEWFNGASNKGLPISGPILKQKALEFAQQFHVGDFTASNGWLESFKKRNGLVFNIMCGESRDVNMATVDDWISKLPSIISGYEPKNIANADESALFFRGIPTKSFSLKGQNCAGGKMSKERISILLCVFADGTIEKPLVIGKAQKPRCFKQIDTNLLPVHWYANKKAWMTTIIMQDWLIKLNDRMKLQKRNILLFLDNATSHPHIELSNVKLIFFPAQTTSILQPLDQGVIQAAKLNYRKRVMTRLCRMIDEVQNASELCKSINVLDAVQWLGQAVKSVTKN